MRGVTPSLRGPPGYEPSYAESRIVGGGTSGGTFQYPGNAGGFNWGSVSVDADNGILVAAPMLMVNRITHASAADRKAQTAAAKARQAAWWKAHPGDKARYDQAVAEARASGRRGPGGNPEGGPAGQANAAFD
jgi:glucose dehydrogenase